MKNKKVLIISDGKPGHLNQSLAFAKIKELDYDILEVGFKSKLFKIFSYIFDKLDIYTLAFFNNKNVDFESFDAFIGTGSGTYYFTKVLGKKYGKSSIVLMLPKSYKYETFDFIVSQKHDNPPQLDNIIEVPLNLSFTQPQGLIAKIEDKKSVGLIIGGDNDIFTMEYDGIKKILDDIFLKYKDHLKYITTSRRTPKDIEKLIESYDFDYSVIYSKTPGINPISDFIEICDEFFISIDSTSMLSEVRANSNGKVNIIGLKARKENTKFHKLARIVKNIDSKIDFKKLLEKIKI